MNWKDTVMSDGEIRNFIDTNPVREFSVEEVANDVMGRYIGFVDNEKLQKLANTQAEISFKAGIREVVEWILAH